MPTFKLLLLLWVVICLLALVVCNHHGNAMAPVGSRSCAPRGTGAAANVAPRLAAPHATADAPSIPPPD